MKTLLDVIIELRRLTQSGVLVWEKISEYTASITVDDTIFYLEIPFYTSFAINGYNIDFIVLQGINELPLLAADVQLQLYNKENGESYTAIWKLLQRTEQEHTQSH